MYTKNNFVPSVHLHVGKEKPRPVPYKSFLHAVPNLAELRIGDEFEYSHSRYVVTEIDRPTQIESYEIFVDIID